MTDVLYGKPVADRMLEGFTSDHWQVTSAHLRIIRIGDDPASTVYINSKIKKCKELGVAYSVLTISDTSDHNKVKRMIKDAVTPDYVTGAFVQFPTGDPRLDDCIPSWIPPEKDVDGLHPANLGRLLSNNTAQLMPATPRGIDTMLDYYKIPVEGRVVGIVGRSNLVGKPLAQRLTHRNATVIQLHSYSDLSQMLPLCDIVVVAIGVPKYITSKYLKEGAVVIDVGINRVDGKLVGDCDFDEIMEWGKARAITPVPKGVGVTTVASLMTNLFYLNRWIQTDTPIDTI